MFTGIIKETGELLSRSDKSLSVKAPKSLVKELEIGSSISVNGVCLTAVGLGQTEFRADVMPETWQRSALGDLSEGSAVNLELALSPRDRFDGHIVQGHVDGIGVIESITISGNSHIFKIKADPADLVELLVEKGSIAVNGISLTIISVEDTAGSFTVGIIPFTLDKTSLKSAAVGDRVNLEIDVIAKYLRKFIKEKT